MRVPSLPAALPPVLIAFVIVTGIPSTLPLPMWLWWVAPPRPALLLRSVFQQHNGTPEPGRYYCCSVALQDGVWTSASTRGQDDVVF